MRTIAIVLAILAASLGAFAQQTTMGVREPVAAGRALDFLFKELRLPRSYLRCLDRGCPPQPAGSPQARRTAELYDRAIRLIRSTEVAGLGEPNRSGEITAFIDRCQRQLAALHDAVAQTYFDYETQAQEMKDG